MTVSVKVTRQKLSTRSVQGGILTLQQLTENGIQVVERIPCQPRVSKTSRAYLRTKRSKMGHMLERL